MNIINATATDLLNIPLFRSDPFEGFPAQSTQSGSSSNRGHVYLKEVRGRVYEETYQRCVGPSAMRLEKVVQSMVE